MGSLTGLDCSCMCDCENMTTSVRDEGEVKWDQLQEVLAILGRRVGKDRVMKLKRKFDPEDKGVIDWKDRNFLMAVCSIGVSDVNSIPERVFSSAFKIFDQDEDDRLSLPETRIVLSIFLPIRVQQEQELVETILYSMDRQKDGYIRKEDLVTGLRSSTSFSLSMYREEFILVGLMVAGFLLYQVAKQYGLVPVIGVYDGPI